MDIMDLVKNASGLEDQLAGLGLDDEKIEGVANGVKEQLGGADGLDLGDLLTSLDADSFLSKVDVGALAEQAGISSDVIESALGAIAPNVDAFTGEGGALGGLGKLAKKFFN